MFFQTVAPPEQLKEIILNFLQQGLPEDKTESYLFYAFNILEEFYKLKVAYFTVPTELGHFLILILRTLPYTDAEKVFNK